MTIAGRLPTVERIITIEKTGRRLPKMRAVLCGGSAVPRALMEGMDRVGLPILQAWGMTETSPLGTWAVPRSWHTGDEVLSRRLTQGVAAPAVEIRIADLASGKELPWDGVAFGEIQVRGPWIACGYLNDADPGRMTADGWFRTGDVATIDGDGYVSIVDRTKDVIKSGGEWISSVELENTIMAHPGVLEAAVIGLPHSRWSERPVAYVVPRDAHADGVTAEDIALFLRDKVERWWLPDEVRFVGEIPKTSVGKFDKKRLRAGTAPLAELAGEAAATPA